MAQALLPRTMSRMTSPQLLAQLELRIRMSAPTSSTSQSSAAVNSVFLAKHSARHSGASWLSAGWLHDTRECASLDLVQARVLPNLAMEFPCLIRYVQQASNGSNSFSECQRQNGVGGRLLLICCLEWQVTVGALVQCIVPNLSWSLILLLFFTRRELVSSSVITSCAIASSLSIVGWLAVGLFVQLSKPTTDKSGGSCTVCDFRSTWHTTREDRNRRMQRRYQ